MKARQRKKNSNSPSVDYHQNILLVKKAGIVRPRLYLRVSEGLSPKIWNIKFGMSTQEAGRSIRKAVMRMGQAFKSFGRNGNAEQK